ncbi:MAG: tRNA 2-selenouridine(34) synthase MnmH, partial [Phycisphaerae bacterium]|nr:tRNA 2-selenouridine(34) synthase MnmH [Saprospiraceae bacterium]
QLSPAEFLAERTNRVMLDVRSPAEYAQGHIPETLSFPLFSDEERAAVGTMYKQVGKDEAMELGLRFVGPKMEQFVKQAKMLAPHRRLAVHCWRGGQRSGSMAWLFRQAGFDVVTLEGGYKAYRHHVLQGLEEPDLKLVVLGGRTGSGKTKILQELRDLGEQIIDLEGLAHHKGSAFGFIGEAPQPTVEQFENELFESTLTLQASRRAWVENESRSIGRIFIPQGFFSKMKDSPLVNVEIPDEARIKNLLADYVLTDRTELEHAFQKIATKLGGQHFKTAIEALEQGDFAAAARIALVYYDKTYQHGLETRPSPDIRQLVFEHGDAAEIAEVLAQLV